jgi:hypothetical protein
MAFAGYFFNELLAEGLPFLIRISYGRQAMGSQFGFVTKISRVDGSSGVKSVKKTLLQFS